MCFWVYRILKVSNYAFFFSKNGINLKCIELSIYVCATESVRIFKKIFKNLLFAHVYYNGINVSVMCGLKAAILRTKQLYQITTHTALNLQC